VIGKILQHLEKTGAVLAGGALLPEAGSLFVYTLWCMARICTAA
jgi:hypothetical protein